MGFSFEDIILAATARYNTPFYLCCWHPVLLAIEDLKLLEGSLPVRHWLSFKTQPVAPLIRKWRDLGYGVEVVSEYEFRAALKEGFPPAQILVNGVAKHRWLNNYQINGIRVHFDSLSEMESLLFHAKKSKWHVGLRCHVSEEYDPDEPTFGGQFGLLPSEVALASKQLSKAGMQTESVHFHLRTNVITIDSYGKALKELSEISKSAGLSPRYIDCGGGLPISNRSSLNNIADSTSTNLKLLRNYFEEIPSLFPSASEIWMENGRFISARSSVLVVKVLDIKQRGSSCPSVDELISLNQYSMASDKGKIAFKGVMKTV